MDSCRIDLVTQLRPFWHKKFEPANLDSRQDRLVIRKRVQLRLTKVIHRTENRWWIQNEVDHSGP